MRSPIPVVSHGATSGTIRSLNMDSERRSYIFFIGNFIKFAFLIERTTALVFFQISFFEPEEDEFRRTVFSRKDEIVRVVTPRSEDISEVIIQYLFHYLKNSKPRHCS